MRCPKVAAVATDAANDGVEFYVNSGWRSPESFDATAWMSQHGAEYGLCQIYRNEPRHFELRPKATDHGPIPCTPTLRTIRGCESE